MHYDLVDAAQVKDEHGVYAFSLVPQHLGLAFEDVRSCSLI